MSASKNHPQGTSRFGVLLQIIREKRAEAQIAPAIASNTIVAGSGTAEFKAGGGRSAASERFAEVGFPEVVVFGVDYAWRGGGGVLVREREGLTQVIAPDCEVGGLDADLPGD